MTPLCLVLDSAGGARASLGKMAAHAEASGLAPFELLDCGKAAFAVARGRDSASGLLRDGDLVVAADARIDGRAALGVELGLDAGLPATALILAAWRRWGTACTQHLLGDYAFAVWDSAQERLFVARDHIGALPLFLAQDGDRFVAASEIGLVLAAGIDASIDEAAVFTKLADRHYMPHGTTFLRHVRRLAPAHQLIAEAGDVRIEQYWFPERVPPVRCADDAEYFARLRDLMAEAVADRLVGAERLGVHVSGGLDCSSIAALATAKRRAAAQPDPVGFSWNRADGAEGARVDAVRQRLGIEVLHTALTAEDLVRLLRIDFTRDIDAFNLVQEDSAQRAAAERGVDVMLSGWGGDEGASFNGRGYHAELLWRGHWIALWREARRVGIAPPRLFARAALQLRQVLWTIRRRRGVAAVRKSLIAREFARTQRIQGKQPYRGWSPRGAQRDLISFGHLATRMEDWAISGARRGIDYRYPMLDRRILEFALGVPVEMFVRGKWTRWLMRNTVDPLLPETVVWDPVKLELERVADLAARMREANVTITALLDARETPPARAHWFDMAQLRADLASGLPGRSPKIGRLRVALQFLDF